MARIVVEQESRWNPTLWNREKPKHVGQWRSADGEIKLNLNAADKFELIVGQTETNGTFSLDGNKLVMVDLIGERFEGELIFDSPDQFRLISDNHPTTFVRL